MSHKNTVFTSLEKGNFQVIPSGNISSISHGRKTNTALPGGNHWEYTAPERWPCYDDRRSAHGPGRKDDAGPGRTDQPPQPLLGGPCSERSGHLHGDSGEEPGQDTQQRQQLVPRLSLGAGAGWGAAGKPFNSGDGDPERQPHPRNVPSDTLIHRGGEAGRLGKPQTLAGGQPPKCRRNRSAPATAAAAPSHPDHVRV